jgi:hypothetical protein
MRDVVALGAGLLLAKSYVLIKNFVEALILINQVAVLMIGFIVLGLD